MSFKVFWSNKKWWIAGSLIGLIVGLIIVTYAFTYEGECWECIILFLPLFPFESIFERINNGIAQVIFAYSFLVIEYIIMGALFGIILSKIIKRLMKTKK